MDKISRTAMGGTSSHAYHCNGTRNRVPRATRSRKPPAPLTMRVSRIPQLTGPSTSRETSECHSALAAVHRAGVLEQQPKTLRSKRRQRSERSNWRSDLNWRFLPVTKRLVCRLGFETRSSIALAPEVCVRFAGEFSAQLSSCADRLHGIFSCVSKTKGRPHERSPFLGLSFLG